jgi:hypothetical protein
MSGSMECTDGVVSSGTREVARCGAMHSYPSASSKGVISLKHAEPCHAPWTRMRVGDAMLVVQMSSRLNETMFAR